MTSDEFNAILDGLVEEAMIDHKLDMCGTYAYATSPMNGGRASIRMDCHDYRVCLHCNKQHISEYFSRLRDETPKWTRVKEENWKAMRKKLGRKGITYLQWPQNDGTRFVLLSKGLTGEEEELPEDFFSPVSEEEWEGKSMPSHDYDHLQLGHILCHVPRDRRSGGKLGRKAPVVEREGEPVKVEYVVHDKAKDRELDREAWEAAVDRTRHLDPKNATEVEIACDDRTRAYKEELKARGAVILSSIMVTRYVHSVASIDWAVTATERTRMERLSRHSFLYGAPKGVPRLERLGVGF